MSRSSQPARSSKLIKNSTRAAIFEQGAATQARLNAISDGLKRVADTNARYANLATPNRAGFIAEELHAMSFNANAAAARSPLTATTGAALGSPTSAHDISVLNNGQEVARAQLKYTESLSRTTSEISSRDYSGMQRVVPAGQGEQVRSLAARRGVDGLGKRDYEATSRETSEVVRAGGVESDPVSLEEARAWSTRPAERARGLMMSELGEAARAGAKAGAVAGAGVSALTAGYDLCKGNIDLGEATERVLIETATGAVRGAMVNAGGALVKQGLVRAGAQGLARSSAPVAIASGLLEVGGDVYRYANGELSGEELACAAGKTAVRTGATWAGAEAGAALGTAICPGLGTVVGGLLGGLLGGSLFS